MFRRAITVLARPAFLDVSEIRLCRNIHGRNLGFFGERGRHELSSSSFAMMRKGFQPSSPRTLVNLTSARPFATNLVQPVPVPVQEDFLEIDAKTGKKRAKRRSQVTDPKIDLHHSFPVFAYATCEELDLERLHGGLIADDLYIPNVLSDDMDDVIHASAKYKISDEPREIFFFRDGAIVFWNMPSTECMNVLKFLKPYEHESYDPDQVTEEVEYMRYNYHDQGQTRLSKGRIVLHIDSANQILEKYAFANAMASSVKLGIWESALDNFVDSIAEITEVLKRAEKLELSREEVLQKTGELYSLRHELNLNSDLLDTPDFYWERERLENLYQKTCNYLNMNRRTKVLNEKMTQCSELLELISTHLTDRHHTRLEWMIILLIMVEVGFEILHAAERYIM
ncbi:required for meiotic nuclear division protein 1 homolog [Folsomia candida]|uniref:required for meiotic nuclear division protein 1 homolog n=1 Tax=Folsomia candida TaxID=158441 RepID=UPI000B8FCE1A|nr:required for meiotic nuclear division protein 1 homolog [Folsomia candida]